MADRIEEISEWERLPFPVKQYFLRVFTKGIVPNIDSVKLKQFGQIRSDTAGAWMQFEAKEMIEPTKQSFNWDAKVKLPLGLHLQVVDSFKHGAGAGKVRLLSLVSMGSEKNTMELNSGALHRYLAEGAWCPTGLLPESGVQWQEINQDTALATITVGRCSVSLECQFNRVGEIVSVYTEGRFGKFKKGYKRMPWQGRFTDYQTVQGIRIPYRGEAGWWIDGRYEAVWKGNIESAVFDYGSNGDRIEK